MKLSISDVNEKYSLLMGDYQGLMTKFDALVENYNKMTGEYKLHEQTIKKLETENHLLTVQNATELQNLTPRPNFDDIHTILELKSSSSRNKVKEIIRELKKYTKTSNSKGLRRVSEYVNIKRLDSLNPIRKNDRKSTVTN